MKTTWHSYTDISQSRHQTKIGRDKKATTYEEGEQLIKKTAIANINAPNGRHPISKIDSRGHKGHTDTAVISG